MKHPSDSLELFEFNLGKVSDLFCQTDPSGICGSCEFCQLKDHFVQVRDWFGRASDQSKRKFLLGLVQRLKSSDLIRNVVRVLLPSNSKDALYVLSRSFPSLVVDRPTISGDRALDKETLNREIEDTWEWFSGGGYFTKINFLFALFKECKCHLLRTVYQQSVALLERCEKNNLDSDTSGDLEASTVESLQFNNFEKRDLGYPGLALSEEVPPAAVHNRQTASIFDDDKGEDLSATPKTGSASVSLSLINNCPEELSDSRDFVQFLPIHVSKSVLRVLDPVSLLSCASVSQVWHTLVREVQRELQFRQNFQKDVDLMQGASVDACNPFYANDVMVAVPNIVLGGWDVIADDDDGKVHPRVESAPVFADSYASCSTRKIIMEERNIYCGPYNVMKLADSSDPTRVVHMDGGKLVAVGGRDKRVHLVDTESCQQVAQAMSGHAGSVRCVYMNEKEGYLMSGSFDTSIRKWSLLSKKCLKFYQGHTETVTCLNLSGDFMASGSIDSTCKVWNVESGKCVHTFRHKKPVTCVALSEELCISGSSDSVIKVWHLSSGKLIKRLTEHKKSITGIAFDRWHIVTSSMDCYLFVWSCRGNFSKSLVSLHHPSGILCLAFKYLRVVTGCMDGKIRVWNILNGHCLRILRGNSRSDPIMQLSAVDNRILVNTTSCVLMMTFETLEYDYTLPDDKIPSELKGPVSRSPSRQSRLSRSFIRAQKMILSGATNPVIIHHKSLVQSKKTTMERKLLNSDKMIAKDLSMVDHAVTVNPKPSEVLEVPLISEDVRAVAEETRELRRTSWSFEHQISTGPQPLSLPETRSLLRLQIRAKGQTKPPDFVTKTMDVIHASLKPSGYGENFELNNRERELVEMKRWDRPRSSPSHIDARTKTKFTPVDLEKLRITPVVLCDSKQPEEMNTANENKDEILLVREGSVTSLRSANVALRVTKFVRPHTATVVRSHDPSEAAVGSRPKSSASDSPWQLQRRRIKDITTASLSDVTMVPMLMCSRQTTANQVENCRERGLTRDSKSCESSKDVFSQKRNKELSPFNDPMRNRFSFRLLTNQQSVNEMQKFERRQEELENSKRLNEERKKKIAWLQAIKTASLA